MIQRILEKGDLTLQRNGTPKCRNNVKSRKWQFYSPVFIQARIVSGVYKWAHPHKLKVSPCRININYQETKYLYKIPCIRYLDRGRVGRFLRPQLKWSNLVSPTAEQLDLGTTCRHSVISRIIHLGFVFKKKIIYLNLIMGTTRQILNGRVCETIGLNSSRKSK